MKRRDFLKHTGVLLAASPLMNFANTASNRKMLVVGIDGMDPKVVYRLMNAGKLPNLQQLANRGIFTMMRTTTPPQSPVAWGSFITGTDPGGYGIFDFIHRKPANYAPYLAGVETIPSKWNLNIGKYNIPLKPGKTVSKRGGKAFWDYLEERDIPATIFKIPTNYPPSESNQRIISGMGTPDVQGGYGLYSIYTSNEKEMQKDLGDNNLVYAYIDKNNVMKGGKIYGPENDLVDGAKTVEVPFKVYVDNRHKTIRIDVQGKTILLAEKELSDWVEIKFPLITNVASVTGMVKFYLLELGKHFRLYISPVHMSPRNPALPISTPASYSRELAEKVGLYHTISLPCDVNALKQLTFNMENYITQTQSVLDESEKIFDYEYARFQAQKKGLLFFYFSPLDLGQHMFWALNDAEHPYYNAEANKKYGHIRDKFYMEHDRILGKALKTLPPDIPIMVLSDHGFNPFRRKVNINNWLQKEGYLKLEVDAEAGASILQHGDWASTRAYCLGFNSLYLNQRGREGEGIVLKEQRRLILEEIKGKLEAMIDPANGQKVVSTAFIVEDTFSTQFTDRAPDIVIGFNRGYRAGDTSALGDLSENILADNANWWSGDHFIDPQHVPASFLATFKIQKKVPNMQDMAPTILKYFGITNPTTMKGEPLI